MRKMMIRTLLACCFMCTAAAANAFSIPPKQPPGGPGGGHHGAPFDGGISLLIAAGAAYGAKKAYNKRMAEKTT